MGIQWSSTLLAFDRPNRNNNPTQYTPFHITSPTAIPQHNDENRWRSSDIISDNINDIKNKRTYQTPADIYYQKHGTLPEPPITHAILTSQVTSLLDEKHDKIGENNNDDDDDDDDDDDLPPKFEIVNRNNLSRSNQYVSHSQQYTHEGKKKEQKQNQKSQGIFIIGDVHGCYDELLLLLKKAETEYNNNVPFAIVIFVGDLCNKGPYSAQVIQFIRKQNQKNHSDHVNYLKGRSSNNHSTHFFAVRGNHDNAALKTALKAGMDPSILSRKDKYAWMWNEGSNSTITNTVNSAFEAPTSAGSSSYNTTNKDNHDDNQISSSQHLRTSVLSDDDIIWMSELPYTITIPASILNLYDNQQQTANSTLAMKQLNENDCNKIVDTIIVHAGFIPQIPIHDQTIDTMVTVRDITKNNNLNQEEKEQENNNKINDSKSSNASSSNNCTSISVPWASQWRGPPRVIFGHDAKRGIQRYSKPYHHVPHKDEASDNGMTNSDKFQDCATTNRNKPISPSNNCNYDDGGDWAIGLDSGACYGHSLTGIILPQRTLVHVKALRAYCPISK